MNASEIHFHGPFAAPLTRFTSRMLKSGNHYSSNFWWILSRMDRFFALRHPQAEHLTRDVLQDWFSSFARVKPRTQGKYRCVAFQFCEYLRGEDLLTASREDFLPLRRGPSSFRPHIFSVEEIATLLEAARRLPTSRAARLRPLSMELIIAILYSAGLRVGEVVRLDVGDYDAQEGTLLVRHTKFDKTRLVPLSMSARHVVEGYLQRRRELGFDGGPEAPLVWPLIDSHGRRACQGAVQVALRRLMRRSGIKPPKGGKGPRVHDMRHTFAAHRVLQWYRDGADVQARLPHLATYMGHRDLESTQLYLTVIPGVLEGASGRLAAYAASALKDEEARHE